MAVAVAVAVARMGFYPINSQAWDQFLRLECVNMTLPITSTDAPHNLPLYFGAMQMVRYADFPGLEITACSSVWAPYSSTRFFGLEPLDSRTTGQPGR